MKILDCDFVETTEYGNYCCLKNCACIEESCNIYKSFVELQKYQKLGTVEELQQLKEESAQKKSVNVDTLLHAIEELEFIQFSSFSEPLIRIKDVKKLVLSHLSKKIDNTDLGKEENH